MTKNARQMIFMSFAALAAGLVNGLLGAGGGIIAVWALSKIFAPQIKDSRDAFANALAVMLPLSAVSAVGYGARGLAGSAMLGVLVLPAVAGGIAGALLLDKINTDLLKVIFSLLIIFSGASMLFR